MRAARTRLAADAVAVVEAGVGDEVEVDEEGAAVADVEASADARGARRAAASAARGEDGIVAAAAAAAAAGAEVVRRAMRIIPATRGGWME